MSIITLRRDYKPTTTGVDTAFLGEGERRINLNAIADGDKSKGNLTQSTNAQRKTKAFLAVNCISFASLRTMDIGAASSGESN